MSIDETNKKLDELIIRASYRYINDIGENMDDILITHLDEEESKEFTFLTQLKIDLEDLARSKQIWKEIEDLEEQAIRAFREHSEWGRYLEALCDSDNEAYTKLMSLYQKVNHETYWRK